MNAARRLTACTGFASLFQLLLARSLADKAGGVWDVEVPDAGATPATDTDLCGMRRGGQGGVGGGRSGQLASAPAVCLCARAEGCRAHGSRCANQDGTRQIAVILALPLSVTHICPFPLRTPVFGPSSTPLVRLPLACTCLLPLNSQTVSCPCARPCPCPAPHLGLGGCFASFGRGWNDVRDVRDVPLSPRTGGSRPPAAAAAASKLTGIAPLPPPGLSD